MSYHAEMRVYCQWVCDGELPCILAYDGEALPTSLSM